MLRYYPKRTGSAFTSANTEIWNYNAKGEVVTANHSNNAFDRSFEFDGIGNRKKSAEGLDLTAPTAMSYNANALNQYSQITNAQISNRLHDADGNLIDDGAKFFVWDAENCLIEIKLKSDNSTVATYAYDYQSRRITKTVGSTVTNFVYDGWNPIAEYTSALSPLSFTLSTSYTWGMDLSGSMQGAGGVGGLLSLNDGSATYYPTFDGNGNVSEYVDATGVVVAHYEYDAFGQVVASGSKKDDFTHQLDSESGLHYYGYRYYDSSNGRWPSRDPIEEEGGVNLYVFVENRGDGWIDKLGRQTIIGPNSNNPSPDEHLGLAIVGDQKEYFERVFPKMVKYAKTRARWFVENNSNDICDEKYSEFSLNGNVFLSVYPIISFNNYGTTDELAQSMFTPDPNAATQRVWDLAAGDESQSLYEGLTSVGSFWFRIPPTPDIKVKRSNKWKNTKGECCHFAVYKTSMELRDSLGAFDGWQKVTRASWVIHGAKTCCSKTK